MGRHKVFTDEEIHQRTLKRIKEWKKNNHDKVAAQQKRHRARHIEQLRIYDHNRYKTMKEKAALYEKRERENVEAKNAIKDAINTMQWVQEYIDAIGEEHKDAYIKGLQREMDRLMSLIKGADRHENYLHAERDRHKEAAGGPF